MKHLFSRYIFNLFEFVSHQNALSVDLMMPMERFSYYHHLIDIILMQYISTKKKLYTERIDIYKYFIYNGIHSNYVPSVFTVHM